ncbi:Helicase [Macrophomina phaseolina MS6]|uniref:DNA 3'-5' helicase n=1 Tax=Macrophomina phaseolina (strain MS6) TaxID=1126212 RepID=K2RT00_MACPH|nr:Helicase [Macrophomina phaseolina MS6]
MDNEIFPMLDGRETRMRQHDNGYFTQSSQLPYKRPQKIPHSQEILQYSSYTSQPPASRGHAVPYADYDYDGFGVGGGEIPFGCFGRMKAYQQVPGHRQLSAGRYQAMVQFSSSPRSLPSSPTMRISQARVTTTQATQPRASQRRSYQRIPLQECRDSDSSDGIFVRDSRTDLFQPDFIGVEQTQQRQGSGMPLVQGIQLVSTHDLPDRFRTVFPFPAFNIVQSKCFNVVYGTNDNFVVSAPTGSGKTAIFELAILRLINGFASGSFKAIYQAPTKALCFERQRDWEKKFKPLGLKVRELTGDTASEHMHDVQTADLIITTPEKWDSMTRRWRDHERLVQMVKLFLIDEVHILKEDRGATLEAVVSRMKTVGTDVRFVALSATVPNFGDIAAWLGKDSKNQYFPAPTERFGEEFRPVKLQRHVIGFGCGVGNQSEFAFDQLLDKKLPGIISKYSQRKPIMVFCFTRKSCELTAKYLVDWWIESSPQQRYWEQPRRLPTFEDATLRNCTTYGVAFHHAGLSLNDKQSVEKAYLAGELNVICCTSTLAVGVNLPCHFVIIKNTVTYIHPTIRECSDLEITQMLGRAGRPQFDDSAVAVIVTRNEKNAEIGLRTITNIATAKHWLSSTFLYVRLQVNPNHYKIEGDVPGSTLEERLERICSRGFELLRCCDLAEGDDTVKVTEYGDIMARYSVCIETMQRFIALPPQAKLSEILTALATASEFSQIRFRQNEKAFYKLINTAPSIKFPILVNLDQSPQKISLIIQSILGDTDPPVDERFVRQRTQLNQDVVSVFQHTRRLVRCIVDCAIHRKDSVMTRNALSLSRSLYSRVWDDSPLTMKQLESIGSVAVRKLVNAGLRSIDDLEFAEPQRLETILGKHPPFGSTLLAKIIDFPKLRVSLKQMRGFVS